MRLIRPILLAVFVAAALTPAAYAGELTVRTLSTLAKVHPDKYKVTSDASPAVRVVGVPNGSFAFQLVVSSDAAIAGLKAAPGDLTGPGQLKLAASAVEVRYALHDGPDVRGGLSPFDSLSPAPPPEVPLYADKQAVQPLWITVHVPAGAKAGEYKGEVTVSADGSAAVRVPLTVRVIGWTMPDPNDFEAHMDFVQSPESVALAYDVEMWSDEHFKLLEQTFKLLRPLADKTIYISAVRRTHFGNEHAMIYWTRDEQGELHPQFDVAERYLDLAVKHLGKVPGVILLVWEPVHSMGHAGGTGTAVRTTDKPIQYSLFKERTGKMYDRVGPAWGSPEAKVFWKRFTDGITPILEKRGLRDSMLLGLIGDSRPTKVAMDDIGNAVKDPQWAVHSHHYAKEWQGYPIGFCNALWGIHLNIVDPKQGHGYGWLKEEWLSYYPRELSMSASLLEQRFKLEMWMGALSLHEMKHYGKSRGAKGLGRLGADFWKVLKDDRGRARDTLAGRYPESYWGQLNLNYCIPSILGRGPTGPLPTVRSEQFREGLQETEARVYLEKAIVNDDTKAKLGDDLAKRCRDLLDERIRMANALGGSRKDQRHGEMAQRKWNDEIRHRLAEQLYELAAEVHAKLN